MCFLNLFKKKEATVVVENKPNSNPPTTPPAVKEPVDVQKLVGKITLKDGSERQFYFEGKLRNKFSYGKRYTEIITATQYCNNWLVLCKERGFITLSDNDGKSMEMIPHSNVQRMTYKLEKYELVPEHEIY